MSVLPTFCAFSRRPGSLARRYVRNPVCSGMAFLGWKSLLSPLIGAQGEDFEPSSSAEGFACTTSPRRRFTVRPLEVDSDFSSGGLGPKREPSVMPTGKDP